MSRSCEFASSQMEVMRERVDGSEKVSTWRILRLFFLLLLLLMFMLFRQSRARASKSKTYHVEKWRPCQCQLLVASHFSSRRLCRRCCCPFGARKGGTAKKKPHKKARMIFCTGTQTRINANISPRQ